MTTCDELTNFISQEYIGIQDNILRSKFIQGTDTSGQTPNFFKGKPTPLPEKKRNKKKRKRREKRKEKKGYF